MKKAVVALALFAASAGAFAQPITEPQSNWMVRMRAVHLDSANKDSTGQRLSINDKWLPEADVSYFFSPNLAAELILTVPQKHKVYAAGQRIGSFRQLPPTLTMQYHFTNLGYVKPYLGAGVNYTRLSSVNILGNTVNVKRNAFGPALQAGFDVPLYKNLSLNVDVKKVWIRTKLRSDGNELGTFKVDPLLVGVGLGYRF
ncbi:MAG: outer membrane beta-barrel protein [Burkholderiaceae bacterium]|nr:outer membrane beta-barrel protein [Burkholderiaceae bacterium]